MPVPSPIVPAHCWTSRTLARTVVPILCRDEDGGTSGPSQARAVGLSAMKHGSRRGVDHSC